jgi:flagellar protein FlaG
MAAGVCATSAAFPEGDMAVQVSRTELVVPTLPLATAADVVSGEPRKAAAPPAHVEAARPEPSRPPVDMQAVHAQVAARLEEYLRQSGRNLEFRVDPAAKATVITVRRADTGEVVRQYPTEEALALLRRLNEQSGTFLDVLA